jgi:DNA-binding HxlR family transcriptional regulator
MDVIGDRWAVLVVRELLFGGKRFAQLRAGLHGISPNVLSQRLRDLEASGVVRRTVLGPPASVTVYELTDRGCALEPVLIELGRWGSREQVKSDKELSVSALMVALKTLFDPRLAHDGTYAMHVEGEPFVITIDRKALGIVAGTAVDADATIETDAATLRRVAFGRETLASAQAAGRATVSGNRALAARFGRLFPVS